MTWRIPLTAVILVAIVYPMVRERWEFLAGNRAMGTANEWSFAYERKDLDALMARLQELRTVPGRVHAGRAGDWGGNFRVNAVPVYALFPMAGIPTTGMQYHTFGLASEGTYAVQDSRPGDLALFGVWYVVAENWPAAPTVPEKFGRFKLYPIPNGGMFDLIDVPFAWEGPRDGLWDVSSQWMNSAYAGGHQHFALLNTPKGVKVLHGEVPPMSPWLRTAPMGRILSEGKKGTVYSALLYAGHQEYVLFRSSYHQGLHASVDGREVSTFMVTPGMLAFPVEAGLHTIKVWYQPMMLKYVLLAGGILGVFAYWRFA